ncbi:DMT family transporter [Leptolyngbya sp. 15MV]|nr:DMT family transporter [Leptolyngbya sp. 15MV]
MTRPDNLRGAALMAAASLCFAFEALAIRFMTERGIPLAMQVAARAAGQLLWVMPVIVAGGLGVFRTARAPMHLLRGVCSVVTWALYYLSLHRLEAATAMALSFTNVVFTTLLAGPLLGERADRWRWAGALIGLLGIAVMLRPGGGADALGAAAAIAGALTWCGITLGTRTLARTESTGTIMAWVGVITCGAALPFGILHAAPLPAADWLILAAFAIVSPVILWLVTEALRAGEASAIAPLQYLRLIFVAALAWLAFGEVPDGWSWLGAAVILAGALLVTVAEARRR